MLNPLAGYLCEKNDAIIDLLHSMVNYLFIVNLEGKILLTSDIVSKNLGFSSEEIYNKPFYDIFNFEDQTLTFFEFLTPSKKVNELEFFVFSKEGLSIPVLLISVSVLKNFYSGEDVILLLMADLRYQKEMQAQLLASNKMASLGEMASGMAHEVNNPLTIIDGQLRRLEKWIEAGESKERLLPLILKTQKNIKRITHIVKAFRSISRKGDKDPFLDIPLKNIINEAIELCDQRLKEYGISFNVEGLEKDYIVRCRESQILQVIINLIKNSQDSIQSNAEKWIRLKVFEKESSLIVSVIDSGHGVALEDQIRLFEPFFTTKDVGKGTGLGLSISKGIMEEHEGDLRYNGGSFNTCFEITFVNWHILSAN